MSLHLRWITLATIGFCLSKFLDFALVNLLQDRFARARARIALQSFDFVWFGIILIACWARKEWPPYFTLAINELPGVEGDASGQRTNLPSSVTSFITSKFLYEDNDDDDRKSVGSIGSNECVMFVNPCNYTLECDDYETAGQDFGGERSAFDDPDAIEEEGLINAGGPKKQDRSAMYQQLSAGTVALDEAHIKAELILAFRDKKQLKKEAKAKQ